MSGMHGGQQEHQHSRAELLKHVALGAVAVLSLVAIGGGIGTLVAANASGTPQDKGAIGHRTASDSNPYSAIEIAKSSIDNQAGRGGNDYLNGHGDHTGADRAA
jgi:hypothetical protein